MGSVPPAAETGNMELYVMSGMACAARNVAERFDGAALHVGHGQLVDAPAGERICPTMPASIGLAAIV
jgi:hypothetical protein